MPVLKSPLDFLDWRSLAVAQENGGSRLANTPLPGRFVLREPNVRHSEDGSRGELGGRP